MLFNSFEYAIFLIIIFMIYWLSPKKFRCTVLMVSSFVFYGFWSIKYFLLFFSEIFTTYLIGVILSSRKIKQKKFRQQIFLFLGIGISVSVLILFKYYDFLVSILNSILQSYKNAKTFGLLNLILPVGISFYTFQCIGYMVDVYRGKVKVEKNFIQYAAFISFFPQLVAGPIERAEYLLPQIKTRHIFSYSQAVYGLKLMAWGYFKKIIIADTLAITVDKMWADMRSFAGLPLIIGAFFFSIQIYCDFSGYSDIARGSAKLLGIELSENFKSPYLSQSVKEFWGRWHISLSSWLRDYVYIPLGGNRKGDIRYIRNIMVTFFISGLWHGADWTFLAWGGVFGSIIVIEKYTKSFSVIQKTDHKENGIMKRIISILCTDMLVVLLWVVFRSQSMNEVINFYKLSLSGIHNFTAYLTKGRQYLNPMIIADIILLLFYDIYALKNDVIMKVSQCKARWVIYICFVLWIYYQIPQIENKAFLYFQF